MFGCPLCQSRHGRPISLRELDDGRVLLHPFCGHDTEEVLHALGLTMSDLFVERLTGTGPAGGYSPSHSRIPPRDILEGLSLETSVIAIIAADFFTHRQISEADWQRLRTAARRINAARDLACGR